MKAVGWLMSEGVKPMLSLLKYSLGSVLLLLSHQYSSTASTYNDRGCNLPYQIYSEQTQLKHRGW